jgi:uncharacterized protein (DUF433 family)
LIGRVGWDLSHQTTAKNLAGLDRRITITAMNSRITANPKILAGKPCVKGTRISVELVLTWIAGGSTFEEILRNYPSLKKQDFQACLEYARELVEAS